MNWLQGNPSTVKPRSSYCFCSCSSFSYCGVSPQREGTFTTSTVLPSPRGSTGTPSARVFVPPSRGYTVSEMRAAEQPLLEAGVPLMRRAAAALAAQIRDLGRSPVIVLAGAGDNGADALYAAVEL